MHGLSFSKIGPPYVRFHVHVVDWPNFACNFVGVAVLFRLVTPVPSHGFERLREEGITEKERKTLPTKRTDFPRNNHGPRRGRRVDGRISHLERETQEERLEAIGEEGF